MLKSLTRAGAAATVAASLFAGSLLLAPAANAATTTHKVDADLKTVTDTVKVGNHFDKVTFKATSTTAVAAFSFEGTTEYAAKTYKLTVKDGSKTLWVKTASTFKELGAAGEIETHKSFSSDKSLISQLRKDIARSEAKSKTYFQTTEYKLVAEEFALFNTQSLVSEIQQFVKDNPTATDFSNAGFQLNYSGGGITQTVTGTPQAYTVTVKITVKGQSATVGYNSGTKQYTKSAGWVHIYEKGKLAL